MRDFVEPRALITATGRAPRRDARGRPDRGRAFYTAPRRGSSQQSVEESPSDEVRGPTQRSPVATIKVRAKGRPHTQFCAVSVDGVMNALVERKKIVPSWGYYDLAPWTLQPWQPSQTKSTQPGQIARGEGR